MRSLSIRTFAAVALACTLLLTPGVMMSAEAHTGESPHAVAQWGGQNCIQMVKVNGPVSSAWPLQSVTSELNQKVASRSSLPAFKLGRHGCDNDVTIDQINRPGGFCVGWRPDFGAGTQERILLNSACLGEGHNREWPCMGWGLAAGGHEYLDRRAPHIRHGCLWDGGTGPDHLSAKEASTLRNAYTGGRYAVGMTPRSKSYHNAMKADPKKIKRELRAPRLGYQHKCPDDGATGPACMWDARHQGDGFGTSYIYTGRAGHVRHYAHKVVHNLLDAGNCHFPRASERHWWDTIHGDSRIRINHNDRVCPGRGTTYAIQAGNPGPVGTT